MSQTSAIATFLLTLLAAAPARAQPDVALQLVCDRDGGRAEIRYYPAPPEVAGQRLVVSAGSAADCRLANGVEVRLKASADQAFPFGRCGAAPARWLSLWVNRHKLLSRHVFAGCEGVLLHSISVTPRGVMQCSFRARADGRLPDFHLDAIPRGVAFDCTRRPLPVAGSADDLVEYPPPGAPPPPRAGSLRRAAVAAHVCLAMGLDDEPRQNVTLPRFAELPDWQPSLAAEPSAETRRATFDFDDSGRPATVWWRTPRTHAFDGDYFVVVRGDRRDDPALAGEPEAGLIDGAASPRLAGYPDADVYSGNVSLYADRYVYWTAFRFADRTYLLGEPLNDERDPAAVVVEARNGRFATICRFERARENY